MKKILYITLAFIMVVLIGVYLGRNDVSPAVSQPNEPLVKKKPVKRQEIILPKLELTMPAVNDLHELTEKIIGFDSDLNFSDRSELIKQLKNKNLTANDFRALMTFLKTNPKDSTPQLEWHSLKNDLLVFLIDDGRFKESTGQLMTEIVNDPNQHEVMREYVLQYTTDYFERHWLDKSTREKREKENLSEVDLEIQEKMLSTMWNMLESDVGTIAGTSLIRLNDLSGIFQRINQKRLEVEITNMVLSEDALISSRMAALSLASSRKMHSLQEMAVQITFGAHYNLSLRMAALHAASTMQVDNKFVEQLQTKIINNLGADKRLKRAARLAIEKLMKTRG
jgi:hypothetical protein